MQAVILAAGKGTRIVPLTLTKPKPLIKIVNKSLLEYQLDSLNGIADEVIIVVGYKKDEIINFLRDRKYEFDIKFVEQEQQLGTGDALWKAKTLIKDRFILMNGDDLYHKDDIQKCIKGGMSLLVKEVEDVRPFGAVIVESGKVKKIVEKPEDQISKYANTGLYVLDKKIFNASLRESRRKEYEITDCVNDLAKDNDIRAVILEKYWLPVGYFQHILEANEFLLKEMKESTIEGIIESNATIKGHVKIGEGTVVKNGSYIQGPVAIGKNCVIGPNCYIRPYTSIGNNCKIGNAVEIKNCVMGDHVSVGHLSYFGDSIFGDNINVGAGSIAANLRHDNQNIKTFVKGELKSTGRRKFGTVIADYVKLGAKTLIYPGRKVWPTKKTLPGEIIRKDIM